MINAISSDYDSSKVIWNFQSITLNIISNHYKLCNFANHFGEIFVLIVLGLVSFSEGIRL